MHIIIHVLIILVISIKGSVKRDIKHEQPVTDSVHVQTTRKI